MVTSADIFNGMNRISALLASGACHVTVPSTIPGTNIFCGHCSGIGDFDCAQVSSRCLTAATMSARPASLTESAGSTAAPADDASDSSNTGLPFTAMFLLFEPQSIQPGKT